MRLQWKAKNIRGLELEVRTGLNNLYTELFRKVQNETVKFGHKLVASVAKSPEYAELMTDPILRAQLGMPKSAFKLGGDTDGPDMLAKLAGFRINTNLSQRLKQVKLVFPTISELIEGLERHLSRIGVKSFEPREAQSWFKWWEFGNAGEANSFTLTLRSVNKLSTKNKRNINDIIRDRSRSGFGIQVTNVNSVTIIKGRGLIGKTYENYAKIFPAFVSNIVKRFASDNKNRTGRFFARGRIS